MKHIIHMAALLAYAAAFSLPLAASAQTDMQTTPAPMSGKHHRHKDAFMRALHTLTLTDAQKPQIEGFISATKQANQNATPDQRKANIKQLHQQIISVLTPEQQQQLNAELAK
jgi:Spy/CpxP family protein refolding chaperone